MLSVQPPTTQLGLGMYIKELIENNIQVRKLAAKSKNTFLKPEDEIVIIREEWEKIEQAALQLEAKYREEGRR